MEMSNGNILEEEAYERTKEPKKEETGESGCHGKMKETGESMATTLILLLIDTYT